jgi:hypothetical protein
MYQEQDRCDYGHIAGTSRRRFVTFRSDITAPHISLVFSPWRDVYAPLPYFLAERMIGMAEASHVSLSKKMFTEERDFLKSDGYKRRAERRENMGMSMTDNLEILGHEMAVWKLAKVSDTKNVKYNYMDGRQEIYLEKECNPMSDSVDAVEKAYNLIKGTSFSLNENCKITLLPEYMGKMECGDGHESPKFHYYSTGELEVDAFFNWLNFEPSFAITLRLIWEPLQDHHFKLTVQGFLDRVGDYLTASPLFKKPFYFLKNRGGIDFRQVYSTPIFSNLSAPQASNTFSPVVIGLAAFSAVCMAFLVSRLYA